ncbi:MAG TPA: TolC family protein [Chryseosolibacter sp.]|nr:TolC family protein [Chryseosolibacter sp.]
MRTRILLLSVLLAISGVPAFSQQQESAVRLWTLKECIDYALSHNLNVKRGELQVELSEVNFTQAKMNLLPSANASASYGYNWGRGLDPVTNQFVSSQRNNVSSLNANGSLTLFNGLRVQNSIKQGRHDVAASEKDLAKARNDASLLVANNFINVVFNKEQVENASLQLASSQQQLDRTRIQVDLGALPLSEKLNLEAQVATNELNLVNQQNALALSILQLKQAMQMQASEELDVEIPALEPQDLILDQDRDEVYGIAREIMPEVKSSKLKIESSYYAMKVAKGALVPRLTLNGSLNTNYSKNSESQFVSDGGFTLGTSPLGYAQDGATQIPVYGIRPTGAISDVYMFDDQVKDNLYKSVGFQLTIPIFNNYTSRASFQRSVISNEQAKINAQEIDNTLRQNIETAYNDAIAASKSYQSALKQVTARDEAFRMMKQRHDIGAANYVEYQVAENNLFQAKSDLARAKYNYIFRKKLLDFYQGKPLDY